MSKGAANSNNNKDDDDDDDDDDHKAERNCMIKSIQRASDTYLHLDTILTVKRPLPQTDRDCQQKKRSLYFC